VEFSSAAVSLQHVSGTLTMMGRFVYKSSTKYGAELNEARRATLMLGPARAPMNLHALSNKRPFVLSDDRRAPIAQSFSGSSLELQIIFGADMEEYSELVVDGSSSDIIEVATYSFRSGSPGATWGCYMRRHGATFKIGSKSCTRNTMTPYRN
jgi:hypothetical protein